MPDTNEELAPLPPKERLVVLAKFPDNMSFQVGWLFSALDRLIEDEPCLELWIRPSGRGKQKKQVLYAALPVGSTGERSLWPHERAQLSRVRLVCRGFASAFGSMGKPGIELGENVAEPVL